MTSFDEFQKEWDEVDAAVFKNLDERDQAIVGLEALRTILGRVIAREQVFKSGKDSRDNGRLNVFAKIMYIE